MEIRSESIIVRGLTEGERASLLVVARDESDQWPAVARRHEQIADQDQDGVVSLALDVPLPMQSLVVAVDESDGRLAIGTPGPLAKIAPPANRLQRDDAGRPVRFSEVIGFGWSLLVRPHQGAWVLAFAEGGGNDADGKLDQRSTIAFERMRDKDQLRGPDFLLPNDVLFVIDTSSLELFISTVEDGR